MTAFVSGPPAQGLRVEQNTLDKCQELLGYRFRDPGLLSLALTHSSVAPSRFDSNERLEFLGDSVLGLVVCHRLYDEHRDLLEGEMTRIKSSVVSRQTCARIAEEMGICALLMTGKGMAAREDLPTSVAGAVFEAIIGAIFLDGGLQPACRFTLRHVRPHVERVLADQHQRNYKSLLQQYVQRRWGGTPDYQLLDEKGPDHNKCFEIAVSINGRHFPSAWGRSKKQAEQEAAQRALAELHVLKEYSPEDRDGQ